MWHILAIGYWLLASQFNPSLGFWWFRVPDVSCFYLSKWAAVKWYAEGYLQFCIKSKSDARVTNVLFRIVASILAAQMPSWSAAARMRTFARCCANQNSVNLPGEVPMSCLFRHQLYSIVGSMCLDFIGTWMTLHRFRSPCKSLKQLSNPEPVVQRVPCSSKTQWPQHSAILFVNDQASPAGRGHCLAERSCETHFANLMSFSFCMERATETDQHQILDASTRRHIQLQSSCFAVATLRERNGKSTVGESANKAMSWQGLPRLNLARIIKTLPVMKCHLWWVSHSIRDHFACLRLLIERHFWLKPSTCNCIQQFVSARRTLQPCSLGVWPKTATAQLLGGRSFEARNPWFESTPVRGMWGLHCPIRLGVTQKTENCFAFRIFRF